MLTEKNTKFDYLILQIALPIPIRSLFDYKASIDDFSSIRPGMFVDVPFGSRVLSGIVIAIVEDSTLQKSKLKHIRAIKNEGQPISETLYKLLYWSQQYYQHPIGEVFKLALPQTDKLANPRLEYRYETTCSSEDALSLLVKAPKQLTVFQFIEDKNRPVNQNELKQISGSWRSALNELVKKSLIKKTSCHVEDSLLENNLSTSRFQLTSPQASIVNDLTPLLGQFNIALIQGVTGSGKTEIYMRIIEKTIALKKQVLVLVPEIALTPQLIRRFENRLAIKVCAFHSALKKSVWNQSQKAAANAKTQLVVGTRSSIFLQMPNIGLVIIDEEHDDSYKQHEGFRYHARDVAIMRAKLECFTVLLGSATPSLESYANTKRGRYKYKRLGERIGKARLPKVNLIDLNQVPEKSGLSITLINAIEEALSKSQQSIIFLNRRGFASGIICRSCNHSVDCPNCNARLTYHLDKTVQCHHCGYQAKRPSECPHCHKPTLINLGHGTQRIEHTLKHLFPNANIARLDRDIAPRAKDIEAILKGIKEQTIDILIGTQMISKGHDYPNVTLVGVINADQGLFSVDYHSTEQMIQQLIQVAGRCGRSDLPGKVLIQTQFPKHPIYKYISTHDYISFANDELKIRHQAGFPPYYHLALIRSSSVFETAPMQFLTKIKRLSEHLYLDNPDIDVFGPVQSPMNKRAGRYRTQLLIRAKNRKIRHRYLAHWINLAAANRPPKDIRWSIDVDPTDLY